VLSGQLVEQIAWTYPASELRYALLAREKLGDRIGLEEQANALASHLLVPAMYDFDTLARITHESTGPVRREDFAWRFLQSLFPETSKAQYSWHNWEEILLRSKREIDWAADANAWNAGTLYQAMLAAALRRDSDALRESLALTNTAVYELWHALPGIIASPDRHQDLNIDEGLYHILGHGQPDKSVLKPLQGNAADARRLPLVPARAGITTQWRSPLELLGPSQTIEEWRERNPTYSVTLYPMSKMPSEPILHIPPTAS
jgi:hypothetical protein